MPAVPPDDVLPSDLPADGGGSPDGRVTVIVGGTSGIGLATALELASRGDRLVLAAREGAGFDRAVAAVTAVGGEVTTATVDVNDRESVTRLVSDVLARHGRIDAMINTAAVMAYGTIESLPADVFETVVDTAIHGTANLAREVLPVLRRRHRGVFVVVNSLLGAVTVPNMGAYATSKWGQRAVVRTLQQETRDEPDVHVCLASPGSINTPIYYQAFNRTGRLARPPVPVLQPSVPARVLADLLDRPRSHVTVRIGPANPLIIAGYRLLPRLYDAVVGPLFRLGALTRRGDSPADNVHEPAPEQERVHGRWPAPRR